jgi:ubiquinol-cytochrome c reductase cytochrome b subunit
MNQTLARLWTSFDRWLHDRTSYRDLAGAMLYEHVPGGSRWIYVTGSMLVCAFVTQVVTGLFLWMWYSPGSQNAWESVYYIEYEVQGGWLLRGMHHYMAQAMVILLPLHLLQVVFSRAYLAPREINYWLGLLLMLIVLALGLTGYLLPWDQKGYWATKVATELMSLVPAGGALQKLVVGGADYGHTTLTRFFALHAGLLPGLLVLLLVLHVAMFRKHGLTAVSSPHRPDEYFWPRQVFKDAAASFAMLAAVAVISCVHQAELGPPAEPTESYGAARPEWYFLFLFQMLKKFGTHEFLGAIVVPLLVMGFLFALPLTGKVRFGHFVNVTVILAILGASAYLTYEAIDHDNFHLWHPQPPADASLAELHQERTQAAIAFHEAEDQAHREFERVRELIAYYGLPREGAALGLVRQDPEILGPRLFRRNCASCHSYLDESGQGIRGPDLVKNSNGDYEPYAAPNLYGFATRQWFLRFLDPALIVTPDVFGATRHAQGSMVQDFVLAELADLSPEQQQQRTLIAAALSAEAKLAAQRDQDAQSARDGTLERGREAVGTAIKDQACTDCHKFHDAGELGSAPDLTGYGSYEWLRAFIADPAHERFYREDGNDRMPRFASNADNPQQNLLSDHDLDMLVRWLRGDDRNLAQKFATAGSAK